MIKVTTRHRLIGLTCGVLYVFISSQVAPVAFLFTFFSNYGGSLSIRRSSSTHVFLLPTFTVKENKRLLQRSVLLKIWQPV